MVKPQAHSVTCLIAALAIGSATSLSAQFVFRGTAPAEYIGKVAHLDIIDGWKDFRLIAEDQLLMERPIDSSGRFTFEGTGLPAKLGFYRIRFRDPDRYPPVYRHFGRRHYVHFLAGPTDTLTFDQLSMASPDQTNDAISVLALKFDRLNDTPGIPAHRGSD